MSGRYGRYLAALGGLIALWPATALSQEQTELTTRHEIQNPSARHQDATGQHGRPGQLSPAEQQAPAKELGGHGQQSDSQGNQPILDGWLKRALTSPGDTFNGVIALCTVILVSFGGAQVEITRRTARRQLRAYLHIVDVKLGRLDGDQPAEAIMTLKNSGQTPAYEVVAGWDLSFAEPTDPKHRRHMRLGNGVGDGGSKGIFGPGETIPVHLQSDEAISPTDWMGYLDGRLRLYLQATVNYRDVFRQKQSTYVLMYHEVGSARMLRAETGNDAT